MLSMSNEIVGSAQVICAPFQTVPPDQWKEYVKGQAETYELGVTYVLTS